MMVKKLMGPKVVIITYILKHNIKDFFLIRSQPTTIVALIYFSVVQWVLHIDVLFVQLSHEVVFFPFSLVCRLGKSTSLN